MAGPLSYIGVTPVWRLRSLAACLQQRTRGLRDGNPARVSDVPLKGARAPPPAHASLTDGRRCATAWSRDMEWLSDETPTRRRQWRHTTRSEHVLQQTAMSWQRSSVVTALCRSTKLLYGEPGYYRDGLPPSGIVFIQPPRLTQPGHPFTAAGV